MSQQALRPGEIRLDQKAFNYRELPDLNLLQELFTVTTASPSGLMWKTPRRMGRAVAGKPAGHLDSSGYWLVNIKTDKSRLYKVHRIIYYMLTGCDPKDKTIDHTRERSDNLNIRIATKGENNRNVPKRKTHKGTTPTSKYKGVSWDAKAQLWRARIQVENKTVYLGRFKSEQDAAIAYNKKAKEMHGAFAVLNCIKVEA
jgi:hypothetical protein